MVEVWKSELEQTYNNAWYNFRGDYADCSSASPSYHPSYCQYHPASSSTYRGLTNIHPVASRRLGGNDTRQDDRAFGPGFRSRALVVWTFALLKMSGIDLPSYRYILAGGHLCDRLWLVLVVCSV